MNMYIIR